MTEFTPFFDGSNQLNYRKFVVLRFHGVSKRKICKMYNFAKKNDYRFTYKDYKFLKQYGVSNTFICKMYHISIEDLEFFEVMNR
ncbi:hypothetical protein ACKAV4_13725 [Staphylococcus aureus]|uniref:hypothetical protein n=1 Tax=Staphylococcus aureus TaxID=1280 RepID=UPI00389E6414